MGIPFRYNHWPRCFFRCDSLKSERLADTCPLKNSRGVKKAERKVWKAAMVRLERSDKRLRKLQASANKGQEAIGTSFKQLGGKPKRARKDF